MEVGVRELKAKLSEYIGRAAAGEAVVVTDRGTPVARLVGLDQDSAIRRGVEEGWVEPPRRTALGPANRFNADRPLLAALDDDRGS